MKKAPEKEVEMLFYVWPFLDDSNRRIDLDKFLSADRLRGDLFSDGFIILVKEAFGDALFVSAHSSQRRIKVGALDRLVEIDWTTQ